MLIKAPAQHAGDVLKALIYFYVFAFATPAKHLFQRPPCGLKLIAQSLTSSICLHILLARVPESMIAASVVLASLFMRVLTFVTLCHGVASYAIALHQEAVHRVAC